MKWNCLFLFLFLLFLSCSPVWGEDYDDDDPLGEPLTAEQEVFYDCLESIRKSTPEDRGESYKKLESALASLIEEPCPRHYFIEVLNLVGYYGECDGNRALIKCCLEGIKANYLLISPEFKYERIEYLRWVLQRYPAALPTVKTFLLENRREMMEPYVEGLAAYLELISVKREKELQKEWEEWDEYYRTRLPEFDYLAERPEGGPESYKEGWPKGLGRTVRYPDLVWPYMVRDSKEREEYIRMLPKAVSWLKLEEIVKLRQAYAEMEPEIFNTFAFFYDSGRENMKELRKILNEKKVPKSMQKKIFEEMKKPYDAGLQLKLSNERRRLRMLEENRD